jgi:receptor protein-tyrosine kinase
MDSKLGVLKDSVGPREISQPSPVERVATMDQHQPQTLDARDYLRPLWANKWLILALVVVVTGATYLFYNHQPKQYTTSTQVFVQSASTAQRSLGGGVIGLNDRDLTNQAELLRTLPVAREVAKDIGFRGDPAALLGGISVAPSKGSDFVVVTATAGEPRLAAALANAFARAFVKQRSSAERTQLVAQLKAARDALSKVPRSQRAGSDAEQQVSQLQAATQLSTADARQIDTAPVRATPVSPQPKRNAVFAFALSLMLGILAAYTLDRFDRRIRRVDSVEELYKAPVLIALPRARVASPNDDGRATPAHELAESFRTLRTTVELSAPDSRALVITSGVPREGKSTIVRNLALAYREVGRRVAVVEGDMRRPTLSGLLGVDARPGLSEVLAQEVDLDDALQAAPVELTGLELVAAATANGNGHGAAPGGCLTVLTSGRATSNPASLLSTDRLRLIIERLKATHDIVLVDSPPLLPVSDTLQLLQVVDGALIVSRVGASTGENADRVVQLLRRVPQTPVVGVIANAVAATSVPYGYGSYTYEPTQ